MTADQTGQKSQGRFQLRFFLTEFYSNDLGVQNRRWKCHIRATTLNHTPSQRHKLYSPLFPHAQQFVIIFFCKTQGKGHATPKPPPNNERDELHHLDKICKCWLKMWAPQQETTMEYKFGMCKFMLLCTNRACITPYITSRDTVINTGLTGSHSCRYIILALFFFSSA